MLRAARERGFSRLELLAVVALGVLLALIVITVTAARLRGTRALAAAQAQARAAGFPLDYADPVFQRHENAASLDPNAATLYRRAFDVMRGTPVTNRDALPVVGLAPLPADARDPLSPEMLSAVREYVARRRQAFQLLHEAAGVSQCAFPIHWEAAETLYPHASASRAAARDLILAVALSAEEGDLRVGVAAVADGFSLAGRLVEEPALLSNLVGANLYGITLNGVQRLISRADLSHEDLLALQRQFEKSADSLSFDAGLSAEVAHVTEVFRMWEEGRGLDFGGPSWAGPAMAKGMWFLKGGLQGSNAEAIRLLMKLRADARTPASGVLSPSYEKTLLAPLAQPRYRFSFVSAMLVPGAWRAVLACERVRAILRSAAACVAALRFRRDRGSWPAALDDLVPAYLAAVPLDPFTGKPLIYRIGDDGILVYTVGENGVDDGGKPDLVPVQESLKNRYDDSGFRLWK